MTRPIASLSLDLDNKWAYLRAAGRTDWSERPGFLPLAVDRVVEVLGELELPLTVFLVGRDLVEDADCEAIRSLDRLVDWEPANHSLNHLPWLHTLEREQIAEEIEVTDRRIRALLGRSAVGFRGPGFSCPDTVLRVLLDNGYAYDASVFPTSVAPLARAYFMLRTGLKGAQRERAKKLYGGFRSATRPNRPYRRDVADGSIWEVPVTVMPLSRTPIHLSYLTYLAGHCRPLAESYFRTALRICRLTGTPPSLLLHPTDFLGPEDDSDMQYFPGMNLPRREKLAFVRWALTRLTRAYDVHRMVDQLKILDSKSGRADRANPLGTDSSAASGSDRSNQLHPIGGHG
jgi:peptidoglycan/xylan/chitin deacetylase (PgdA/CDA1 family)